MQFLQSFFSKALILLVNLAVLCSPLGSLKQMNKPILNGSFVQPELLDSWSDDEWEKEFEIMQNLGMDHLILQWTADSKARTAVYPTKIKEFEQETDSDVIAKLLAMGQKFNISIFLGLQLHEDWFENYVNDLEWLDEQSEISRELIVEIEALYGDTRAFKGWYLPFEVDNWNFPTKKEWLRLADFYNKTIHELEKVSVEKRVMISPFFNTAGGLDVAGWQEMWTTILQRSEIDIIALQDGMGVNHAKREELPTWFDATHTAIRESGKHTELWADTETFTSENSPMMIADMVGNMKVVQKYVDQYTSFSFNHYLSPQLESKEASKAYEDYLAYLIL